MKTHPTFKHAIYAAVVILALVALTLALMAPSSFVATKVVYQRF